MKGRLLCLRRKSIVILKFTLPIRIDKEETLLELEGTRSFLTKSGQETAKVCWDNCLKNYKSLQRVSYSRTRSIQRTRPLRKKTAANPAQDKPSPPPRKTCSRFLTRT